MDLQQAAEKKFALSYSCGKDCTLALHKLLEAGAQPAALVVMVNKIMECSYFHGASAALLRRYEEALGIPMLCAHTDGQDYHLVMENGLRRAGAMGAQIACFGDCDITGNRIWSEQRSRNAGLEPFFPLWEKSRGENLAELLALGYRCLIKSVDNTILPRELLGQELNERTLEIIRASGADPCGKNGEYHTLALDGPVFRNPVTYTVGDRADLGQMSVINIY